MADVVWVSKNMDGEPRYMRVRARAQRFHLAAGWSVVDEADVPDEIRNPVRVRPVRRERVPAPPRVRITRHRAPASSEASTVAAPRRRNPAPHPVEEN